MLEDLGVVIPDCRFWTGSPGAFPVLGGAWGCCEFGLHARTSMWKPEIEEIERIEQKIIKVYFI